MTQLSTESPEPTADAPATTSDPAANALGTKAEPKGLSHATKLIKLAEACELFHTPSKVPFVTCEVNGHTEIYPLRSSEFEAWLMRRMFINGRFGF